MVFQDDQLFPHRDVAANIAFGLRMQRVPAAERDARVAAMLDLVGLGGFGSRQVTDLSGGEAKRVALARALAPAPRALLLDEPLTGLDRELHDRLAVELGRILRATGTTTLLVTHDRDEAAVVADRIVTTGELQGHPEGRRVVELTAEATHDLRRRVLRTGTPSTDVVFADDDAPTTVHLGLVDEQGTVIAISSWAWRPFPADPSGRRAVQLRGMAVDPARQRTRSRGDPPRRGCRTGAGGRGGAGVGERQGFGTRLLRRPRLRDRGRRIPRPHHGDPPPSDPPPRALTHADLDFRFRLLTTPMPGEALRPRTPATGGRPCPIPTSTAAEQPVCAAWPARLDESPLLVLHHWAGEDTWSSPRVEECRAELASDQIRIRAAADELRIEARRLECRAEVLEASLAAATEELR